MAEMWRATARGMRSKRIGADALGFFIVFWYDLFMTRPVKKWLNCERRAERLLLFMGNYEGSISSKADQVKYLISGSGIVIEVYYFICNEY